MKTIACRDVRSRQSVISSSCREALKYRKLLGVSGTQSNGLFRLTLHRLLSRNSTWQCLALHSRTTSPVQGLHTIEARNCSLHLCSSQQGCRICDPIVCRMWACGPLFALRQHRLWHSRKELQLPSCRVTPLHLGVQSRVQQGIVLRMARADLQTCYGA